ncbi:uncharacterized protein LOC136760225 [Amia ocellicauda]|uniref:uncharacterized protein LOC136760225 n=1 Tax=Amia ocellicauda TaxID=2972642 RepID=UPI003464BD19
MGNGGTERFNRTLGSMLRTLPLKEKHQWPQQIQTLTFAYNATVHETTGYAPFFLMFGRVPRLPVDVMFKQGLNDPGVVDYDSYGKSLLSSLQSAMEIAQKHSSAEQQHQAQQYNRRVKGTSLSVGDRVLVANKTERGKRKLADKWEDGVYTVVGANPSIHVYKIQDTNGHTRVVHRNLLLEVNFLPLPGMCQDESEHAGDVSLESEESDQEDCDSGDETAIMVGVMPQEDTAQDLSCSGDETEPAVLSPGDCPESKLSDSQELVPPGLVPSPARVIVDSPSTAPAPHVDTSVRTDSHSHSGSNSHIRTRAGRLVKSVNRLIESMIQKPFQKSPNILLSDY